MTRDTLRTYSAPQYSRYLTSDTSLESILGDDDVILSPADVISRCDDDAVLLLTDNMSKSQTLAPENTDQTMPPPGTKKIVKPLPEKKTKEAGSFCGNSSIYSVALRVKGQSGHWLSLLHQDEF